GCSWPWSAATEDQLASVLGRKLLRVVDDEKLERGFAPFCPKPDAGERTKNGGWVRRSSHYLHRVDGHSDRRLLLVGGGCAFRPLQFQVIGARQARNIDYRTIGPLRE